MARRPVFPPFRYAPLRKNGATTEQSKKYLILGLLSTAHLLTIPDYVWDYLRYDGSELYSQSFKIMKAYMSGNADELEKYFEENSSAWEEQSKGVGSDRWSAITYMNVYSVIQHAENQYEITYCFLLDDGLNNDSLLYLTIIMMKTSDDEWITDGLTITK